MLKLNTVLTALGLILLAILGFCGSEMWSDVKETRTATTTITTQVNSLSKSVDDHETRIRQTERDVTILQQQREDRTVRSPKMTENKP